ncbi:MAG TPA: GTP cyclohydrolase I FolE [Chroococcales cyanobacterium]
MECSFPKPLKKLRPQKHSATRLVSATALAEPAGANGGKPMDLEKIAEGVRLILEGIGEDPLRQGLIDTPSRVARMYEELVYGTHLNPGNEITCSFEEDTDELVLVKDIPFSSVCEHHLVPFVGVAHVGYIPRDGRITGLSKLARVVELASRRLQVQERMTTQVADAIEAELGALGVGVVLEAEHFCMSIRGVRKPGSKTVTSAMRGKLKTDRSMRSDMMSLIQGRGS